MNTTTEWYKRMLRKYGSDDAITEIMRKNAAKSGRNPTGTGGWADLKELDPELHKRFSSKGGRTRHETTLNFEEQDAAQSQGSNSTE